LGVLHAQASPKKISIHLITLLAVSRLIPMKANYETQKKKGTTMKPLTQFKKILTLLIAPALVAIVLPTVSRADAVTD